MIRTRHTIFCVAALLVTACAEHPSAPLQQYAAESAGSEAGTPATDMLMQVRRATARFHSIEQAFRAGYGRNEHCVGAMGMHWGNRNLVDPHFEPEHPEVLLYEPRPNGQPRLVGVEYVVINVGQPRPSFDGYLFDINGSPVVQGPHWTLHVWLHQDNPLGMFEPYNPTVSCG
jgi:hypothetical protein